MIYINMYIFMNNRTTLICDPDRQGPQLSHCHLIAGLGRCHVKPGRRASTPVKLLSGLLAPRPRYLTTGATNRAQGGVTKVDSNGPTNPIRSSQLQMRLTNSIVQHLSETPVSPTNTGNGKVTTKRSPSDVPVFKKYCKGRKSIKAI